MVNRHGMSGYEDKERRKIRRENHIARDLRTPKYRSRRVEMNKDPKYRNLIKSEDFDGIS